MCPGDCPSSRDRDTGHTTQSNVGLLFMSFGGHNPGMYDLVLNFREAYLKFFMFDNRNVNLLFRNVSDPTGLSSSQLPHTW